VQLEEPMAPILEAAPFFYARPFKAAMQCVREPRLARC
jgi:hypothetical protein